MAKPLTVRAVTLGQGAPKICAPMVGRDLTELRRELNHIRRVPFDLVEWRADFFSAVADTGAVLATLDALRAEAGEDLPILFTFRTRREGGNDVAFTPDQYRALNAAVAETGAADLVDVELDTGRDVVNPVIAAAKRGGAGVVLSHHNFRETPDRAALIAIMTEMLNYDVQVSKVAVMPQNRQDVLTLMSAVTHMTEAHPDRLNIAISMGELGILTRLAAEFTGSVVTFGAAVAASAPGQISTGDLQTALEIIHRTGN